VVGGNERVFVGARKVDEGEVEFENEGKEERGGRGGKTATHATLAVGVVGLFHDDGEKKRTPRSARIPL
jgi:hypothetical protein